MNEFASLGVSISRDGSVPATTAELDKFSAMAQRAEIAAGKLYNAKFNKEARDYAATVAQSTGSLWGFEAIAARAALQAEHITRQMQKLSMADVRNDDIQAYGREMDQLRARFSPMFAAQQRFKALSDEINHAQRVGAISSREAADALMREQAAFEAATAAINTNTAAMKSNGTAARSSGAQRANAINLMYQGQDIAMMAMLGQAPHALALQQGMQVGGIFSQMGNGRAIVQGLTSAIGMMINPLNIATILTIGLGAAGVQAFMNMGNGADEATTALETNREKMERLLTGYSQAKSIVDSIFEAAARLPHGVVASDLNASLREQEKAAKELNELITGNNSALAESIAFFEEIRRIGQMGGGGSEAIEQAIQQIELLRTLGVDMNSTRAELEAAAVAAREFYNATEDEALREMADNAYQLIMRLIGIKDEAQAAGAALRSLPRDIQIRISMSQEFGNAFSEMTNLYQDPRSRFEQMREQAKNAADQAIATAGSYGQAVGAAEEYDRVLKSINAAEAEANAKSFARSAKEADKPRKAYDELTKGARDFIAAQELEQRALFMTSEAASRLRYEQQLLNQAQNDNIKLSAGQTAELMGLASQMAAAEQASRQMAEAYNFGRDVFVGMFSDLKSGLRDGQSLWEALGNTAANALDKIADRALSMAANGIWDMIFGAAMGGLSGGLGGGMFGRSSSTPLGFGGTAGFYPAFPSFAGGGHTGFGARTGGLDGLGGFMAMLHPNETVIDHTRPFAANQNQANDNRRGDLYLQINGSGLSEQQLARAIAEGIREYDAALAHKVEAKFRTMQNDPRAADGGW